VRWTAVQLALAAFLIITVLLVGTEAGRLLTPVRAIGAVLGAVLIYLYIVGAPRHDLVDALVLAGLLAFVASCLTSSMPRLSFDAAASAIAYTAAFFVARGAVADARGRDLAILTMGVLGTLLSLILLASWATVWIGWIRAVGLPPLDLALPSAPYAGIHVAILVGLLAPACFLLARRRGVWPIGVAGSVAACAVIVMSGSRTVWLGAAAALLAVAVLGGGRSFLRLPKPLIAAAAVAVIGGVVTLGPQILGRLATGSTVELRLATWSETLERWLSSPVLGFGPGTFPAQFSLTEYNSRFEPWHSHAHNVVVQQLLESGIVGLFGLALLAVALVVGIRRQPAVAWGPAAGIVFLAAVSATENPTVSPYLVAPLIAWAALAAPRAVETSPLPRPPLVRRASLALAGVAGAAMVVTLAASGAYDRAADLAEAGPSRDVVGALQTAAALDPSLAFYRRELGTWLMAEGDLDSARAELGQALELNPADPAALRAWALLGLETGEWGQALEAAITVQQRADLHAENPLTLAYVAMVVGDEEAARTGLIRAVRLYPWLLAAPEWDMVFPDIDKPEILAAARDSWAGDSGASRRNLMARTWLNAMTNGPMPPDAGVAGTADAASIRCDRGAAEAALGDLDAGEAADLGALQARLMYGRIFDAVDGAEEEVLLELIAGHDPGIRRQATVAIGGTPAASDHNRDLHTYSRIPIRAPIGPVLPTPASGLSAWMRDPVAAADAGAPGSALADCM
jgi:O-antigen ligase/tetratricopeptide (TPR) repeat protein